MDTRIGIVGWNYPEWKGLIYAEKTKPADFLAQYADHFSVVEAASSYYGMPKTETVRAWADSTPSHFQISLKVPDWLMRKGPDDPDTRSALNTFLAHMEPLSDAKKLGVLVNQFHPNYHYDKKADDLRRYLDLLPEGPVWAVELRDPSWWRQETYDMLSERGIVLVWSDLGDLRTPQVVTADRLYLRLFGDRELKEPYNKKRRDARSTIEHWAAAIQGAKAKRADVLLSKYLEGYAPASAQTMTEILGVKPPGGRQRTLF